MAQKRKWSKFSLSQKKVKGEKKMASTLQFSQPSLRVLPPALKHNARGWYIEYYKVNPIINMPERTRIRLNKLRQQTATLAEFKFKANDMMMTLTNQLVSMAVGSASYINVSDTIHKSECQEVIDEAADNYRQFLTVEEMIDLYLKEKEKVTRPATFRSYKSSCLYFKKWIHNWRPDCRCISFNQPLAVDYMDALNEREDISARTYNNNIKYMSCLFTWAVKKCYVKKNYFDGADKKQVQRKKRTIIPANAQKMIDNWFMENNPSMCIIMRLVYTALLRPVEISRIQVHQIDFNQHCIHMTEDKTKNKHERDCRLDDELENMLRKHIEGAFPSDYLFSYGKWTCGYEPKDSNHFTKEWERMRTHLLDDNGNQIIPDTFQLYSLRDTSINGMIKEGVDNLSVMQAAGHHDLKMTLIYANHADPKLIENLNQKAPKFAQLGS